MLKYDGVFSKPFTNTKWRYFRYVTKHLIVIYLIIWKISFTAKSRESYGFVRQTRSAAATVPDVTQFVESIPTGGNNQSQASSILPPIQLDHKSRTGHLNFKISEIG